MARRFIHKVFMVLLLGVLLLGASAAAPTPQDAVRRARATLDRAQFAEAGAILDDALRRFANVDREEVWLLRVMRGELVMSTAGLEKANAALQFTLPAKYQGSATAVQLAIMRALADQKRTSMRNAFELASRHHPPLLADVYLYTASIWPKDPGALGNAEKAFRLAQKYGRGSTEAKAATNIAYLLARRGRLQEAIEWGERALTLTTRSQLTKTARTAQGNLGWAYFDIGDYENAERLFHLAAANAAPYDLPVWLIQLGNVEFQKRNWQGAVKFNSDAASLAEKFDRKEELGYAYANLARAALELGRVEDAAQYNAKAQLAKKGDKKSALSSDVVAARIAAARGDRHGAETIFEHVLGSDPDAPTRIEAETYLAKILAGSGRNADARAHFDRAVTLANERRTDITDADLRFAVLNPAAYMFDEYVDFLVRTKDVSGALRATESSRARALEEGVSLPTRFDARAVARNNKAVILSYWLGRARSFVWVITPSHVTVYPLAADANIASSVRTYRDQLLGARGNPERSGAAAKSLYDMLIPRAVTLQPGERVIVIGDGELHTLNFETLMPRAGRYWIEDVVIMDAPSLQLIARGPRNAPTPDSALVIGDAPAVASFPRLAHAQVEIGRVAARFPKRQILQGSNATPDNYKIATRAKFDVQHFVAHGVSSSLRPLDSAIVLAAPNPSSSYRLLARDVMKQRLDVRLVTISSCHGVGTRTYAGEGVVGLAWAFLKAGADRVIAALWEVNDSATPDLMDTMYGEIRTGRDPADALRDAKLKLIRGKDARRNPMYWAPFVLYAGT